jgi:transcriptional regulator with XRE-family HTH domain
MLLNIVEKRRKMCNDGEMKTALAKQIAIRMRAKNFSIHTLEKEAGLKMHAVRNIMRGKSISPSVDIVHAVAETLGCTVKDLLQNQEIFQEEELVESKDERLNEPYAYPVLYMEVVQFVNNLFQQKELSVTVKQALTCFEEIYFHSAQHDPTKVDKAFGEWWIDLVVG